MELGRFQLHKWITSLVVLAIIIFLGGCMLTNHPSIISSLKVEREIVPTSGSCQVECIVSDRDGSELSYEWSANGTTISEEGPMVTWTAPLQGGEVAIIVTVSDSSGGIATNSMVFKVETCACAFR